jgi:hypothetical protein
MNSFVADPNVAVGHAGAISAMPVSSRSAVLFYEPSELPTVTFQNGKVTSVFSGHNSELCGLSDTPAAASPLPALRPER